jgi:uncharacterized membrane-anchored protein
MKKYKWLFILLNLVLLVVYFSHSVFKKETLLLQGQVILLELAPIDPRSLMQGDYMTLRYKIAMDLQSDTIPKRGYCVVRLDSSRVAHKIRLQNELSALKEGEYHIAYTSSNKWNISIGAESYFFQEGQAEKYDKAKYGGVKIDNYGNSLLIGLYDQQLQKIE